MCTDLVCEQLNAAKEYLNAKIANDPKYFVSCSR